MARTTRSERARSRLLPRTTSRSCSTTSWSRRRTSTGARTRTASTARTARRSPAGFTIQTAQDLAKFLKIGALPIQLELISRSQVSATLGKQALDQGLVAGLVGFGIVALFLLVFYRVLGVVAVAGLAIYALYFYALVKLLPIVLTLPGIAGLILTIGVAADANIVIFERVKEEVRAADRPARRSPRATRRASRRSSTPTSSPSSSPSSSSSSRRPASRASRSPSASARLVSLLTAVIATQAILLSLRSTSSSSKSRPAPTRRASASASTSWARRGILLGVRADPADRGAGIAGKGLELGIDFESGTRIKASLERPASVHDVRTTVEDAGFDGRGRPDPDGSGARRGRGADPDVLLSRRRSPRWRRASREEYGLSHSSRTPSARPSASRSPTQPWSAIIASLLVIAVYIALRFQWKFAVPVLIALMHDILITAGVYALLGREVTASTVAALLTILGFSLYESEGQRAGGRRAGVPPLHRQPLDRRHRHRRDRPGAPGQRRDGGARREGDRARRRRRRLPHDRHHRVVQGHRRRDLRDQRRARLPDAHGAERRPRARRGRPGARHAVPAGQPEPDPDRRGHRHQRQDDHGAHAGAHPEARRASRRPHQHRRRVHRRPAHRRGRHDRARSPPGWC